MKCDHCYSCMGELTETDAPCPRCGAVNRETALRQPEIALPCGTELYDKYVFGRVLGRGSFGITYLGWDELLEMRICIKEYFPDGAAVRKGSQNTTVSWQGDAEMIRRGWRHFIKEACKAAKLRDLPSVVKVWDSFQANDTAYIVMDYIEGVTLRNYLIQRERPLTENECVSYFAPILRDLATIHNRGIIHRDISPDNLMLKPDGQMILLDLGAAQDFSGGSEQSSFVVIRKGFSPLEQQTSNGRIGPWTDVYAVCANIYHCLTGKLIPEPAERCTGKEIDMKGITPAFAAVLTKGLEINYTTRTQSTLELLSQLEAALTDGDTPRREETQEADNTKKTGYVSEESPEEENDREHTDELRQEERQETRLLPLLSAAVLLLALGLYLIFGNIPFLFKIESNKINETNAQTQGLIQKGREAMDSGDPSEALEYFIEAVEAGNARPMTEVKALYHMGVITPSDDEILRSRFSHAAQNGAGAAMTAMGDLYAFGLGMDVNYEKAMAWYAKGAEAGDSMAMVRLACMYQEALGVEEDYTKALEWYLKAAEMGNEIAMYNIGLFCQYGIGVEKKTETALKWYKKSAKAGYGPAEEMVLALTSS